MGKYMKKLKSKSESPSPNSTPTPTPTPSPSPSPSPSPTPITTNSPPPTTPNSSDGVRTCARTLALENSNNQNQNLSVSSDSYLQLRNRRLKRPLIRQHSAKRSKGQNGNPKSPAGDSIAEEKTVQKSPEPENAEFEENAEDTERSARETTPVHLIMRADVLRPPRPITRRTFPTEANPKTEQPTIPISREFEEFCAKHEAEQQREFMEKYNFDPVTEQPLPGRYEWEKVSP